MKIKLPKNYELSGPYFKYSSPWGKVVESMNRRQWFLTRSNIPEVELKKLPKDYAKYYRAYGKTIGEIERFDNQPRRYILPQTYPTIEFNSLQKIVDYLIDNEGKIVYCT